MFRSLHMKLVLIMLLLITSLMTIVGAFLTTSITGFYIDEFYQQVESVFGDSNPSNATFVASLRREAALEDGVYTLELLIDASGSAGMGEGFSMPLRFSADASGNVLYDLSASLNLEGSPFELGLLAEFLEGLPYKSDIMLLREEDWYRMSVGEQTAFINRLKSRLARYEEYDRDRSNWESFGQANAGDWVYRVPLSMLP